MSRVIEGLRIDRETRTPLGATLHAVGDGTLASRDGPRLVVLVTDGKETCKGDPERRSSAARRSSDSMSR